MLCFTYYINAQNRNSVWAFGDSAGIDFSILASPVPFSTSLDTRGTCVSIADTNGLLQFYVNSRANLGGNTGLVWNRQHNLMVNGDSILSEAWYHEMIILPFPGNDSLYYLFSIGVTGSSNFGLYYSTINMMLDSGRGAVVQKNIQLRSSPMVDCLAAVKHGNGRDWWLIFREWDAIDGFPSDTFYTYLISSPGISNLYKQVIGSLNYTNAGYISFSKDGDKFVFTNWMDLTELYDFNRCTGVIVSYQNIEPMDTSGNFRYTWSSAFSPDDSKLYVAQNGYADSSLFFQYDLNAADIQASKLILDTFYYPLTTGGLKLGPDDKIYLSCGLDSAGYPYPNNYYYPEIMNLSVINQPNNSAATCGYSPFSFNLGGKRTYFGLPNNPDYELGPLAGSPCDTLTSVSNLQLVDGREMFVFHHAGWQKLFVNAQGLKGKHYVFQLHNLLGGILYKEEGSLQPPYFFRELDTGKFAQGLYVVSFITEKEKLVKRFVK